MRDPSLLREEILALTQEYAQIVHKDFKFKDWSDTSTLNRSNLPYSGRIFDENEVIAAVNASLDFWLTLGSNGEKFESCLSERLGVKSCILTNSGSSANLLAISALTSYKISSKKRINKGDEVITVACGFPTTVAPIIQIGATPVFVDVNPYTTNVDISQLEEAYNPDLTKAVIFAHSLGNPFELNKVLIFCQKYDLWLIEDNCDALGSTYTMPKKLAHSLGFYENSPGLSSDLNSITRYTGSWGDLSTQSFYPPHHLTMGEGGAINVLNNSKLAKIVESFRDWGRDCWCPSGKDNSCHKRYEWALGDLPPGYDHKYIYSHLGYNLKPLDLQAAIGIQQLQKLDIFIERRIQNWNYLRNCLDDLSPLISFSLPSHAVKRNEDGTFLWDDSGCKSNSAWFGFQIQLPEGSSFSKSDLAAHLDKNGIGNRMLFGGNLVKQPAFQDLKRVHPDSFRVIGNLSNSDFIMNNSLFVGVYPGLRKVDLDKIIHTTRNFFLM